MAKLYFYYAAMNAGKSTILLQASHNYIERGMSTHLFVPAIDDRYAKNQVTSRIGIHAPASTFDETFDFFDDLSSCNKKQSIQCVFVDEAQFLTKAQVKQLAQVVDQLNIPVLTYGLRADFRGEPFEGSLYLLILSDVLFEIKTVCYCGRKAIMSLRIEQDGQPARQGAQIEIGGNERYIAVCRYHFYNPHLRPQTKKETSDGNSLVNA